jgi:hypothetical protein
MQDGPLNLEDTLKTLNVLRELDLATVSYDEISKLLRELSKHIAIVSTLPAGRVICRTVSCNYLKDDPISIYPLKISQLSYNPNLDQCNYNRASWKGQTAFYGSVATKELESYYINAFELLTDLQESANDLDRESFVVGKWIVTKDIPLVHISGSLKHNEYHTSARYEALWKSFEQYPNHMIPLQAIDRFLCEEYVKTVPSEEKYQYKLSAAYAQLLKDDNWPGILYPSVKSDGAGYNVALFPETLKDIIVFERAALFTYYKRGKSLADEITMEALPDGEYLRWKETSKYLMHPKMKRWYLGLSDDNSFEKYISYTDL